MNQDRKVEREDLPSGTIRIRKTDRGKEIEAQELLRGHEREALVELIGAVSAIIDSLDLAVEFDSVLDRLKAERGEP